MACKGTWLSGPLSLDGVRCFWSLCTEHNFKQVCPKHGLDQERIKGHILERVYGKHCRQGIERGHHPQTKLFSGPGFKEVVVVGRCSLCHCR